MFRVVLFLVAVVASATGLSWLADRPGNLVLNWEGYEIETSVFRAVVLFAFLIGLAIFAWSIFRQIWTTPASVGRYFTRRRQERGLDALSSGMIAIGAGDKKLALRYAGEARKTLPNEPLTHLLRAQAAQLSGDRATSRRIFEAMLASPDTEQLGLRGLFLEAQRESEHEAASQFAARALELNPKLTWPFESLFELQCKGSEWAGALKSLATGYKNGQIEKADSDRRRAVLLTAQALAIEVTNGQTALDLAMEAHNLAPDLIPAAAVAGRQLASRGSTPKAAKVIERTWKQSPHPDLAVVYAFARPGDSPRDRLDRIKRLARTAPHSAEGPIAIANAAVDARNWDDARAALAPLLESRLSPRVCTLMARIEGGERQNAGAVREWLARAVTAPRDPAWTADGMVSDSWAPISPVTGALDAFQWKVPLEATPGTELPVGLDQLAEFSDLGRRAEGGAAPVLGAPATAGPAGARPNGGGQGASQAGVLKRDADVVDVLPPDRMAVADVVEAAAYKNAATQTPSMKVGQPADTSQSMRGAQAPSPQPAIQIRSPAAKSEASVSVEIVSGEKPKPVGDMAAPAATKSAAAPTITVAKPAAPVAAKSSTAMVAGNGGGASSGGVTGAKPFVPPRAPDDPGLEESDEVHVPRADYVAKAPKRTH